MLIHIHNKFKSNVYVIYASPTIIDINELVKHRKHILDYSNFAKAIDLQGHKRNTYISSGTYSIACSKPEEIENINILKLLKSLSEQSIGTDNIDNEKFIIDFSSKIKNIISEYTYLSEAFNLLNEDIAEVQNYKLFYSFLVMNNYRQLTGNQWLVKI